MVADVFDIVGSVIHGAYRVEAVVAEGGFAVVYRAQHQGFNAPVALKCLKLPEKLDAERQEAFLRQFRAEGELLFELSAALPTVVRPLAIDALTTKDGTFVPYMVLEWLEGETLDVIVERRSAQKRAPLPIKKLVRLLGPIADALAKAHNFSGRSGQVSIVHSDIKPENIFLANVAGEEVVKILDFGVAKAQSVANQVAGRLGVKGGVTSFTPAFAAPEQWKPEQYGETGPWTDVWGLALTMVEALAGRPVIEGDPAAMMGAAFDPIARPTPLEHGVDVGDAVEAVFARAVSIDPRERQRDVGVFWSELLGALGMKPERGGDTRREAGAVPREELVEAALPAAARRGPPRPAPPRAGATMRQAPPRAPTRPTLGVDNPFEDSDDDLEAGLDSVPPGLEASLPSVPPGGDFGGEASLPSIPAPPRFGGEAPLPSVPPRVAGRRTIQQTAAAASNLFELDSVPPPPDSVPPSPVIVDEPLGLEVPEVPKPAGSDPFGDSGRAAFASVAGARGAAGRGAASAARRRRKRLRL